MSKSSLVLFLLTLALFPNLVFAAWWNPVSWSFWPWNYKQELVQEIKQDLPTDTEVTISTVAVTPEKETPKVVAGKPAPKVENQVSIIQSVEKPNTSSGESLITDADRQRFGYKGKTYYQTLEEIILMSGVSKDVVLKGMVEEEAFKLLMEDLMNKYEVAVQQTIQTAQAECIMAATPDGERTFDPETQDYLRKLRCGVATSDDKTNYELSQLRNSIVVQPVQTPQFVFPSSIKPITNNRWQVRWEGNGVGTLVTPGGQQRFHCESSGCQSY